MKVSSSAAIKLIAQQL